MPVIWNILLELQIVDHQRHLVVEPSLVRPAQKVLCSEGTGAERQHNGIRHFDRKRISLMLCRRQMYTIEDPICQLSAISTRQELRLIPRGASPPQNRHDRVVQLSHVLDRGRRRQQFNVRGFRIDSVSNVVVAVLSSSCASSRVKPSESPSNPRKLCGDAPRSPPRGVQAARASPHPRTRLVRESVKA